MKVTITIDTPGAVEVTQKSQHPPGALLSTTELIEALRGVRYNGQTIWLASKKFCSCYPFIAPKDTETFLASMCDYHVGTDKDHNDWYLFSDEALARRHAGKSHE